ncbi:hypothetical protein EDC19_1721 [Natranaerovirga hydrolytica]|uniref:Uncharacterized protein n=1 Tax=Natranaerovirga hydrolytica TaxID=680378 RepID=A0A4R1ML50_9FIRM|nr:hypothetical protein [Natranaerovirga hydrolytica]TCK92572.1 hypothetical protein EDC19_1721 [Natranaerovirga hydrolytica]
MNEQSATSLLEQWEQIEQERITEQSIKHSQKVYKVHIPIVFVVTVGLLVGLGIFVGAPLQQIMKVHLIAGLVLSSFTALILVGIFNKKNLIKMVTKQLKKEINTLEPEEEKMDFAKDMLENGEYNVYSYTQNINDLRVLFGGRFILQKGAGYYVLIDTQKVERISIQQDALDRSNLKDIHFYYASSSKMPKFLKNNRKSIRFYKSTDRDEVLKRIQDTYNLSMIEK